MSGAVVNKIELLTGRRHYFGSMAAAVLLTMLLAACGQGAATPTPGTVSDDETSILEEPGNINLALREAQNGMGPSIVGDPAAVYGQIMTYTAALKAGGSNGREGESQAWKFDRLVYLYLFEGDIADGDPRTSSVTDWAQKVVIIDAETGSPFTEITHREPGRLSVSQFLPLTIRDDTKGVPPREIKSLNRPPTIPVGMATPASKPVRTTPAPTATPAPLPPSQGVHTPEDYREQYEMWPGEYKFAIDDEVSVRFAYPSPIIDFAGFAFISHIPSASTVVLRRPYTFLDSQGNVSSKETGEILCGKEIMIFRHYESGEGEARLESVLGDEMLIRRILAGPEE